MPVELLRRVQVMLVEQQHHAAVLQGGHGAHPVDEEGVRHRDGSGGHDDQLVDVGHRRTLKGVPPGQDLLHIAFAVAQLPDSHPVPHQGERPSLRNFPRARQVRVSPAVVAT